MMTHPEHELLSAYADGQLDATQRGAVESHLAGCADARGVLDAIRATLADMAALDEPEMDPQAGFAIRAALARERKLTSRSRRYAWASGAAAAAVIGIIGFVIATGDGSGRDAGGGTAALSLADASAEGDLDEFAVDGILRTYMTESAAITGTAGSTLRSGRAEQVQPASEPYEPNAYTKQATGRETLNECTSAIERSSTSIRLVRSLAATYKSEPVYILLFEVPANDPMTIELWVTTRDTCQVRYFTQADIPR